MAVLTKNGDILEIELTGRWADISDAKEKVKAIPGRRWNPEKKVWTVPADPSIADRLLKSLRPDCDDELMEWLRASMTSQEESLTTPLADDAKLLVPWGHQRMSWQPAVVNDEKFEGALPWQRAAIDQLAEWRRALLCDDMGLGKTFESITAIEEWRLRNRLADLVTMPEGPRLVVAPSSVLGGWNRELNRWLDEPNIQLVDASDAKKRHAQIAAGIKDDAWIVVNWEQLRIKKIEAKNRNGGKIKATVMKEPLFQYPQAIQWDLALDDWDLAMWRKAAREFGKSESGWLAVVADEIHRAKNKDSQQSKGLHRITGQVMYGLTGTPIMNAPDELWSLLRWLWPDEYHENGAAHSPGAVAYWPFYNTYVDYWEDHNQRKIVTGVKNPDALRYALKGKLIRRTASILNLKGRKRFYYDVPLTAKQQKLYKEAEKAMWLAVEQDVAAGNKDAIAFARKAAEGGSPVDLMRIPNGAARFVRLQQIIENAALLGGPDESANMDDFEAKFEESGRAQWIVFCNYKQSCELLAARLAKTYGEDVKVEIYNGDVPPHTRTDIEDAFQKGQVDVIVGTIAAMYQGVTFTSGHMQYWMSRAVVPAWNEQGEARSDRLGQQELVRVYIPQATDTVAADKIQVINRLKSGIVSTIVPMDKIKESHNE
jgi:SNF2 family DNA or RNA helicase